jgi:hypothetical protein
MIEENKQRQTISMSEYANNLITDMKQLSNSLKPINKNIYEVLIKLSRVIIEY